MSRLREIELRCAANRLRMTQPRRVVIRVIAETRGHPDVQKLYRRARAIDNQISLSTVYRNLKLLERIGVLQRHEFRDGRSRYEITPTQHHDHLIDVKSGRVMEFQSPEIERLQAEIARQYGYRIIEHRLEIYATPSRPRQGR